MGGQQSNPISTYYTSGSLPLIDVDITNKIFEKPFQTHLFDDPMAVKELNDFYLEMLVDIIQDPIALTNTSSYSETFSNIILPIIQAPTYSKPLFQQLMIQYSKYLQTRANSVLDQQEFLFQVQKSDLHKYDKHRAEIILNCIKKEYGFPKALQHGANLLQVYSFLYDYCFGPSLNEIFNNVGKEIKNSSSAGKIIEIIDFGFGIRHAFVRAFALSKLISNYMLTDSRTYPFNLFSNSKIANTTNFNNYFGFFNKITLKSSLTDDILYISGNPKSLAYWNGNLLFISKNDELYSLDMKKNDPNEPPFTKLMNIKNVNAMAVSNNVLILSTEYEGLKAMDLKTNQVTSIQTPKNFSKFMCSDTRYIYCVSQKSIHIFTFTNGILFETRSLEIHKRGQESDKTKFFESPKLFDTTKILTDTIRLYTDGTIIYLGNYETDMKLPSFGGRYYSLVDGSILGDFRTEFKYYISGIVIDPFERAMYIRSEKSIEKHIYLGPSPLWLTGINPEQFSLDKTVKHFNPNPVSIGRFTYTRDLFMLSHLAGYLWIDFPKSHAPYHYEYLANDPNLVDWILEGIRTIAKSIKNGTFSKDWTAQDSLLSMQTYLLLAGISIENHYQLSGMAPFPVRFLTDLKNYLTDPCFSTIRQTIIYVFIITAKRLCPLDINIANDALIACLTTRDPYTTDFALTQMMDSDFFIKIFDSRLVEFLFTKMIENMVKNSNDNGAEWFISKFLSELMYSMNKVLANNGNISDSDKKLLDSYIKFSSILLEQMIVNENTDPKFIILFRKWMSLSQPFVKFSYISKLFMSFLQPLFVTMTTKLRANLPNNISEFNQNYAVLLEVYFLYIQLISSLLFGGEEISLVKDFTWLINSALKSKISPETINNLYPKIFEESKKADTKQDEFIFDMINKSEKDEVKMLMDYLYKKCPNPMNKRLTEEDRHIERVTLSCFIKQLGMIDYVLELIDVLKSNKTPNVSLNFKQMMEMIYKTRRTLKQQKQNSNTLMIQNGSLSNKIDENFDIYLESYLKKCVFMLNIEPSLKFNAEENQDLFSENLKKVTNLICSMSTLEDLYSMMMKANDAKRHISTSIALLSDLIISNRFKETVSSVFDIFKKSDFFIQYIETLPEMSEFKSPVIEAILERSIQYMFELQNEPATVLTVATFIFNILQAISVKDKIFVVNKLAQITQKLTKIENNPIYRHVLSLCALNVFVMIKENPKLQSLDVVGHITSDIFPENNIQNIPLSLMTLVHSFGGQIPMTIENCKDIFSKGNPDDYHSAAVLIQDLMKSEKDKIKTLKMIFGKIGDISSGKPALFFKNYPLFHEENQFTANYVRSVGVLLNGCSQFIHIIRSLLKQKDELINEIITFILDYNSPDKNRQEKAKENLQKFEKFTKEKYLFSVFSILSNVIGATRRFSFIKDTNTNQIYYMVHFDAKNNYYYAWKIPFSNNSEFVKIQYGPNIIPMSVLPFTSDLYQNYESLNPYFKENMMYTQKTISKECLSYYILNSFNVYMTNTNFLKQFTQVVKCTELKYVTFSSDLPYFRKVLRHHLSSNTNGFFTKNSKELKFTYHSPSDVVSSTRYSIEKNKVTCKDGIHCFMTQTLQQNRPSLMTFKLNTKGAYCRIGLINLSVEEGDGDSLLVEYKDDRVNILSNKVIQTELNTYNKFIIQLDPLMKLATIYNGEYQSPIETIMTKSISFSFIIQCYGESDVSYNFYLPDKSATHKFFEAETSVSLPDDMPPIVDLRLTTQCFESRFKSLLRYDAETLKATLTEKFSQENAHINFPKSQPISFNITNIARDNSTYNGSLFATVVPDSVIDTICNIQGEAAAIDDSTGLRIKVSEKDNIFRPKTELPSISPMWWGVLSPETLNYFGCGYSSKARIESQNLLFLNMMNDKNISVESVMNFFNLKMDGLLKIFLSLLLYNDKIIPSCLVDFEYDIFDKMTPPKSSQLFLYKTAIERIIDYVEKTDKIQEFTEKYFTILVQRFNNVHYHSVIDSHPSAVVIKPSQFNYGEVTISRQEVTAWIAIRGGLSQENKVICQVNGQNLSNNVLVIKSKTVKVKMTKDDQFYIVLIPFSKFSNESLIGTFVDLAVSLKYFIRFLCLHLTVYKPEILQKYRQKLYVLLFDSIIGNSSYFNAFGANILTFLSKNLHIISTDISGEFLQRLNYIIKWNPTNSQQFSNFIMGVREIFIERKLIFIKKFFPEFANPSEKEMFKLVPDVAKINFSIPVEMIPFKITPNSDLVRITNLCKRLLMTNDITSFPFYILLNFWAISAMKLPPFDQKLLDDGKTLHIKFRYYVPKTFRFVFKHSTIKYDYYCSIAKDGKKVKWTDEIQTANHSEFFINLGSDESWSMKNFTIQTDEIVDSDDFISEYRNYFVSDMKMICQRWNKSLDMAILRCIPSTTFEKKELDINFNPEILANNPKLTGFSMSLLYCRAIPLLIINWMKYHNFTEEIDEFNNFITPIFKLRSFLDLVRANNDNVVPCLKINRDLARRLRDGTEKDIKNSIIYQIFNQITIDKLKNGSDQPWKISFTNERGIDMGGLARELVTEVSIDLRNPNCGLVCPTPNSISQVGYYRDKFIFVPTRNELRDNKNVYMMIGALLLLVIRTGLVQEFDFAPVVWRFLVSNKISIEDIYEIDVNYKNTMESIKESINSGMSEEEFSKQFNLNFVVKDSLGQENSLNQLGRSSKVTMANANEFIALSNEFRINELQKYLSWVRIGFLQNIKSGCPSSLDPDTLEFSACGDPECSYEDLAKIVRFEGISEDQQTIFFNVIQKFTPEQRAALIKFTTGRARLPPSGSSNQFYFIVDSNGAMIDKLPTSSTCFHVLHMPRYTSFENAYKMIALAVENTESFENA